MKLVAILNLTPDSFFDGDKHNDLESALRHLKILISKGADVIDIGAESTRPDATPISADEEWNRLKNILPAAIKLISYHNQKNQKKVEVSLDSRHHQTIAKGLLLGIDIINDVSGFASEKMIQLAVNSGKKIVVMHNLGVPANPSNIIDQNLDVFEVLIDWMKTKLQKLQKAGVKKQQIIFDIGVGFGKNAQQSIQILQQIDRFKILDLPLYVGHSNKSFLDHWNLGDQATNRAEKTKLISKYLIERGVDYLRVHEL